MDHSLTLNAPLREKMVVHAVTEEKCAGGHLAQILVEDQDLHPLLLHPPLLHPPLIALFANLPARSAVEIVTGSVDAFKLSYRVRLKNIL